MAKLEGKDLDWLYEMRDGLSRSSGHPATNQMLFNMITPEVARQLSDTAIVRAIDICSSSAFGNQARINLVVEQQERATRSATSMHRLTFWACVFGAAAAIVGLASLGIQVAGLF